MKTNKTKTLTKIISCFLCTAITLQVGLALTGEKVNAAGGTLWVHGPEDSEVDLILSSPKSNYTYYFYVEASDQPEKGKYMIYNRDPESGQDDYTYLQDISLISIYGDNGNAGLVIGKIDDGTTTPSYTDVEATIISQGSNSSVWIFSGNTLTTNSFSSLGPGYMFSNEGTIRANDFKATDFKDFHSVDFTGSSALVADTVDLTGNNDKVYFYSNAIIKVRTSFTNDSDSLGCTVYAVPDTIIKNPSGGKFTLQVIYDDGTYAERQITEVTDSSTAAELMDDPQVTLKNVPSEIYVGEDVEKILKGCIKNGDPSYTGTPYLEYRLSGDSEYSTDFSDFTNHTATTNRKYDVRVVAPAKGSYGETVSDYVTFTYNYYPYGDVSDSDEYFTLEGVDESGTYIIDDSLTVTPAEGFQIACSHGENSNTYLDQLELSESEITNGVGGVDYNVMFSFKKTGDDHAGAETNYIDADTLMPGFDSLIFETEAPEIYGIISVEGTEEFTPVISDDGVEPIMDYSSIPINDGDIIKADELTFGFADRTLTSVTVDGTAYTRSDFDESDSGEIYFSSDPFTSTPGKSQKISVSATDKLNRTTSATITLKSPELGDVTASVSLSPTIYYGESYEPTLTVKGTDESYEYAFFYDGAEEESEQPTDVGTHTVYASVFFSEYEESVVTKEITFTIVKRTFTPGVSVADILPIEMPEPVITGVPEDYEEEPKITYKDSTGAVHEEGEFFEEGTYTVSVVFPATDKYAGASCSDSFTVARNKFTPSVSVSDILVGQTPSPVITGVPEDYEEEPVITYKSGTGAVLKDGDAFAAGTYTVSVVFPATGKYAGVSCSDSFTVAQNKFTPSVSVADITVGQTPNPLVKGVPSDYDGTVTCEYKLSSAADTAYSSATPEKGGKYTVRASFSGSKKYLDTACTSSFTVKKKVVTATVSVADITIDETPNPVVTTESDGKARTTFEYSSDSGKTFSSTVPTEAGTYIVRATVPETDKYEKIVCTASFSINKKEVKRFTISVPDTFAGLPVAPTVDTESDGTVTITYTSGGSGPVSNPTAVGTYTAIATVTETKTYKAATCETSFTISYLGSPSPAYTFSGTPGKNGYFTSDVDVAAPSGFSISTSFGSGYGGSVSYSEGMTVYLRRSDGALTGPVSVSDKPKIDKDAPSISISGGVTEGSIVFASSVSISASDKHLASLTVNGNPVSSGTTLSPGMWMLPVTVTAEDEAGNVSTMSFTLKSAWLENKVLPPDVELPLPPNEEFYLPEGSWKITKIVNGERIEDPTVYSGDVPIYVDGDADGYIISAA